MNNKLFVHFALILLCTLATATGFAQEFIILKTYYPPPYGGFDRLRLVPKSPALTGACPEGTLYYNNVANRFEYCPNSGTWGQVFNIWTQSGNNVYPTDSANTNLRVGIGTGTATPDFKLHLAGDGGILATGTWGSGASLTTTGSGTRMIWYPRKAAFRAGEVTSNKWDEPAVNNIGNYSAAMGYETRAKEEATFAIGYNTRVDNIYSFAGGGVNHSILGQHSATAGGGDYLAGGGGSTIFDNFSAAVGGRKHTLSAVACSAFGGEAYMLGNTADRSTIAGGYQNVVWGPYSFIGSGILNGISSSTTFIGGGESNSISSGSEYSLIIGGYDQEITGTYSTILGGAFNDINGNYATITGGGGPTDPESNSASADFATVTGGYKNSVTGIGAQISGGWGNTTGGVFSAIGGGGGDNRELLTSQNAEPHVATGNASTIAGGSRHTASETWTTVGGGVGHFASSPYATVSGGWDNIASGPWATVVGGAGNYAMASGSAVLASGTNHIEATATNTIAIGGWMNTFRGANTVFMGRNSTVDSTNSFIFNPAQNLPDITQNYVFLIAPDVGALIYNVGIGLKNPSATLHVNGTFKAQLTNILNTNPPLYYQGGGGHIGFDLAEIFETSEQVEVGDLLVIDKTNPHKLKKNSSAYDKKVAGVVSGAPAILFEGSELHIAPKPGEFKAGTKPPVALAGRVLCKVSLENGPIKTGDMLTTSSTPGHAMKAEADLDKSFGTVIGKALEPFAGGTDGEETGAITIFIALQ